MLYFLSTWPVERLLTSVLLKGNYLILFFFFFSLSWLVSNWKILATVRTSCIYVICHMCKSKVILKTLKKKKPVVTEYNCIKINNNNSLKFSDKLSSIFPFVFLKIDFFNFNWIGQFLFC